MDCEGSWSYGTCEKSTGLQSNTFIVTTAAQNGGEACEAPGGQTETVSCDVDCEVSWNNYWSDCEKSKGKKYQENTVTVPPKNNGKACPGRREQNCDVHCEGSWEKVLAPPGVNYKFDCGYTGTTPSNIKFWGKYEYKVTTQKWNNGNDCDHGNGDRETRNDIDPSECLRTDFSQTTAAMIMNAFNGMI